MNKQQLLLQAKRTIDQRRNAAVDTCEKNLAELRTHDDWRVCENSLRAAQVAAVFYNNSFAKNTIAEQKAKMASLLAKYGYQEKDLKPQYTCTKCNDSGYIGEEPCTCLKEELRKLYVGQSNVQNKKFTFENSTETNKHNIAVYKKAKEVCQTGKLRNMLLTGGTGTGKTYLLSSCANHCANNGKSVLFVTAYNLNTLFLECHLGDLHTKQTLLDDLNDVDVLAIDDLGTENVFRNVTAEYLFALLNERIANGKQTLFSTNLTLTDIRDRYDERIFSRLVDQNITFVAQLEGGDKRLKK